MVRRGDGADIELGFELNALWHKVVRLIERSQTGSECTCVFLAATGRILRLGHAA